MGGALNAPANASAAVVSCNESIFLRIPSLKVLARLLWLLRWRQELRKVGAGAGNGATGAAAAGAAALAKALGAAIGSEVGDLNPAAHDVKDTAGDIPI